MTGALESHFSGVRKNLQFVHLSEPSQGNYFVRFQFNRKQKKKFYCTIELIRKINNLILNNYKSDPKKRESCFRTNSALDYRLCSYPKYVNIWNT